MKRLFLLCLALLLVLFTLSSCVKEQTPDLPDAPEDGIADNLADSETEETETIFLVSEEITCDGYSGNEYIRVSRTYDEKGNLVSLKEDNRTLSVQLPGSDEYIAAYKKTDYTYSASGELTSEIISTVSRADESVLQKQENTYEYLDGLLTKKTETADGITVYTLYTYDDAGREIKRETRRVQGAGDVLLDTYTTDYFAENVIVAEDRAVGADRVIEYRPNMEKPTIVTTTRLYQTGDFMDEKLETYTYADDGRVLTCDEVTNYDDGESTVVLTTYEYDDENRLVKEKWYSQDDEGKEIGSGHYTYNYNEEGNLYSRAMLDSLGVVERWTQYEYVSLELPVKK